MEKVDDLESGRASWDDSVFRIDCNDIFAQLRIIAISENVDKQYHELFYRMSVIKLYRQDAPRYIIQKMFEQLEGFWNVGYMRKKIDDSKDYYIDVLTSNPPFHSFYPPRSSRPVYDSFYFRVYDTQRDIGQNEQQHKYS